MGKKAVQVSGELWQEICTVGWSVGAPDKVECIKGLPEGATFCEAFYEYPHMFVFVFEHPDWPEIEPGEDMLIIEIAWGRTYGDLGVG